MEEIKKCSNCKYFEKHYVIAKSYKLRETSCGSCGSLKVKIHHAKKHIYENSACKFWEERTGEPQEMQSVETVLSKIEKDLKNISMILEVKNKKPRI